MSARKFLLATALAALLPSAAAAGPWGVLEGLAGKQWQTTSESQERVSIYQWDVPGKVLIARHGTRGRLELVGDPAFADTVQRFVLQPDGTIEATYDYADARPDLVTHIAVSPDGKVTETFRDGSGVERRNVYLVSDKGESLIDRAVMQQGAWSALPTTTRKGQTAAEYDAEIAQRRAIETEISNAQLRARREQAELEERNRIRRQQEDARIAAIESEGLRRAVTIASDPYGRSYEQIMQDREIEQSTIAALAAQRAAGGGSGGSGGGSREDSSGYDNSGGDGSSGDRDGLSGGRDGYRGSRGSDNGSDDAFRSASSNGGGESGSAGFAQGPGGSSDGGQEGTGGGSLQAGSSGYSSEDGSGSPGGAIIVESVPYTGPSPAEIAAAQQATANYEAKKAAEGAENARRAREAQEQMDADKRDSETNPCRRHDMPASCYPNAGKESSKVSPQ